MLQFLLLFVFFTVLSSSNVPRFELVFDGRVVGGAATTIERFPYQISMRFFESHRCGGSIFKPYLIISAAHCAYELAPKYLKIVAGTSYLSHGGVVNSVKDIIIHEDFNAWNYDYDIALLKLMTPFDYSGSIQPIYLASQYETVQTGTKMLLSGWGNLAEGYQAPDILQNVNAFIVDRQECARNFEGMRDVTDRMLCAGHPAGGRDACHGDSGGPLVANGKLYGVVSWSLGCARREYPGVYADVVKLRNWIFKNLNLDIFIGIMHTATSIE